jgi:hypothetical protein
LNQTTTKVTPIIRRAITGNRSGGWKEEEKPPPKSSNKIKQLLKN